MNEILEVVRLVISLVGWIGNALTFYIFSKPIFAKNSISIYCRALAIADSIMLMQPLIDIGQIINGVSFNVRSSFLCKIYVFIYSASSVGTWILVCLYIYILYTVY